MGLLDSILGGTDANGAPSSLLGNKKLLLAVGVLAYLAMKHRSQGADDAAPQARRTRAAACSVRSAACSVQPVARVPLAACSAGPAQVAWAAC